MTIYFNLSIIIIEGKINIRDVSRIKPREKMKNFKSNNTLLTIISSVIIIITFIYVWIPASHNPLYTLVNHVYLSNKQVTNNNDTIKNKKFEPTLTKKKYNLSNMLDLMQQYRKIEASFFANFKSFLNNPQNNNHLTQTLKLFKKERKNFKKYFYKIKRNSALRYYFKIIENNIDGIEEMIEKVRIHSKIMNKKIKLTPPTDDVSQIKLAQSIP